MFKKARESFKKIRATFYDDKFYEHVREFEIALQKLITEYNTSNWENRFVVGGALEILFCALLKSTGHKCKWINEQRYDLEINNIKFSIKSNFTGKGDIRLINVLGDEVVQWMEPTLFFISEVGICYADPEMHLETKFKRDALTVDTKHIKKLVEDQDEWLIRIKIPRKPQRSEKIKTASYDVTKSILEEIDSTHLSKHLPEI